MWRLRETRELGDRETMERHGIAGDTIDNIWNQNQAFIHRFLIGLTHDFDLADDLLQDTYLRACDGFCGYRGGDSRAWLTTIAKSAFYSNARRKGYSCEREPLTDDLYDNKQYIGTNSHVDLLSIQNALTSLSPELRRSILLHHYAGLTYEEIAICTNCPVGTAKWRVNAAAEKIKHHLGFPDQKYGLVCPIGAQNSILKYVYSIPGQPEFALFEEHLQECALCQTQVSEYRSVMNALTLIEGDRKMMHFIDIDKQGLITLYLSWSWINITEDIQQMTHFYTTKRCHLLHWIAQDEDLVYTRLPDTEQAGKIHYEAQLPTALQPGQRVDQYMVLRMHPDDYYAKSTGDNGYCFEWNQQPSDIHEYAYILAIRIPENAHFIDANPLPHEIRIRDTHSTPVWVSILAPGECFKCVLEYSF